MAPMPRYAVARSLLWKVEKQLGPNATDEEREKAYFHAYPWGVREYHPYKAWCRAVRDHRENMAKYRELAAGSPPKEGTA